MKLDAKDMAIGYQNTLLKSFDGHSGKMPEYHAISDKHLYEAQLEYEKSFELWSMAQDQATEAKLAYEIYYANYFLENKGKESAAMLKELVIVYCKDLYSDFIRAESVEKKLKAGVSMWESRINTLKHIGKIKHSNFT